MVLGLVARRPALAALKSSYQPWTVCNKTQQVFRSVQYPVQTLIPKSQNLPITSIFHYFFESQSIDIPAQDDTANHSLFPR